MPENYICSIASVHTWRLCVWDLVFETLPLKFNRDGARAGRMPERWHNRLILEDKQDTGQILYARKLQILDRIGAHMPTLCVRPCFRDPPTNINRDKAHAGRMPKRWHTRLIFCADTDSTPLEHMFLIWSRQENNFFFHFCIQGGTLTLEFRRFVPRECHCEIFQQTMFWYH